MAAQIDIVVSPLDTEFKSYGCFKKLPDPLGIMLSGVFQLLKNCGNCRVQGGAVSPAFRKNYYR